MIQQLNKPDPGKLSYVGNSSYVAKISDCARPNYRSPMRYKFMCQKIEKILMCWEKKMVNPHQNK